MGFGNIKAERKAIEATYEDSCDIIRMTEKEIRNITKKEEQIVYKNIPCGLSAGNSAATQTETVNNIRYTVKIFMAPEIDVKAGDKIKLNRLGVKEILLKNTGETAVYATHQEIIAERSDWA